MINIVMTFAQLERETIVERVTDNYYFRANNGYWAGGYAPYGYKIKHIIGKDNKRHSILEVNEEQAKIVKKIYDKYKYSSFIGIDNGYESITLRGINEYSWDFIKQGTINDLVNNKNSLMSLDFSNVDIEEVDQMCNDINDEFGDVIVAYRNSYFIDIVPKGCSKGNGVDLILKEFGVNRENLYVIGDSYNDISMFNETKNSFTFHTVEEKLKDHVNFIVNSVSECIEKYIL